MFPRQRLEDGPEPDQNWAADRTESDPVGDREAGEDAPAPEEGAGEEELAAGGVGKPLPTGSLKDWPDEGSDEEVLAGLIDDLAMGAVPTRQPAEGAGAKRKAVVEQPGASSSSRPTKRRLRKASGGDLPPQRKKAAGGPRAAVEVTGYAILPLLLFFFCPFGFSHLPVGARQRTHWV